ncbi:hypothetical protein CEXT_336551 [Caerostris extrusa]|uniref:Uncharacterized protein n=1 Tax=Caerostris extrusa TaxID=172846 RepID=A0AAV4XC41_CAEEX|nr:hypothetical protein CEXT_336551 [Caerostris extrusa]
MCAPSSRIRPATFFKGLPPNGPNIVANACHVVCNTKHLRDHHIAARFYSQLTKRKTTQHPKLCGHKKEEGKTLSLFPGAWQFGGEMCPDCFSRGRIVGGSGLDQRWDAFFLCTPLPKDDRLHLLLFLQIVRIPKVATVHSITFFSDRLTLLSHNLRLECTQRNSKGEKKNIYAIL